MLLQIVKVSAESTEETETVVEALEFKNGLGMSFQFHPEYMQTKTGRKIISSMVTYVSNYKKVRAEIDHQKTCAKLLLKSMF